MRCGQKRGVKVVNFQGDFFFLVLVITKQVFDLESSPGCQKNRDLKNFCKKSTKFDIAHFFMLENRRLSAISWILTFRKNEPKKAV